VVTADGQPVFASIVAQGGYVLMERTLDAVDGVARNV